MRPKNTTVCTVEDCERPHSARGLCRFHYALSHRAKHGPAYISWCSMRQRCTNPKATDYERYGGRGISFCEEWNSFAVFLSDMGHRPLGTTLDRIDNDGNYEPGNCKWATPQQQGLNQTRPNALKTHCPNGHEYTPENLSRSRADRVCRLCINARSLATYYRKKVEVSNAG